MEFTTKIWAVTVVFDAYGEPQSEKVLVSGADLTEASKDIALMYEDTLISVTFTPFTEGPLFKEELVKFFNEQNS